MDAETRAFLIVNVLAAGLLALVLVARALGGFLASAALVALAFLALAVLYLALDDTAADRIVGRWLRAPFRGPAGWTKPRRRA